MEPRQNRDGGPLISEKWVLTTHNGRMFDIKYLSNHYFYCFDYKQQEQESALHKKSVFFSCEHKFAVKIQCLKQKFKDQT